MQNNTDRLYLGIDGGGTKTHAVIARADGQIVSEGFGGPGNYHAVGIAAAQEGIRQAVEQAWAGLGGGMRRFNGAFLGMAGVVSQADQDVIRGIARALDLAPENATGVDHDLRIALAGGLAGRQGIVLIAGTGSSCYGRSGDGHSWRAGGWGHVLDDCGGGYWLGLQGIIAATRALDGRGSATTLSGVLSAAMGLQDDLRGVLAWLHGAHGADKTRVAALAPLVLAQAEAGDSIAQGILKAGAGELALMVRAVVQGMAWRGLEEVPVVFIGGLLHGNPVYRSAVQAAVVAAAPNAIVCDPAMTPAAGAALLACKIV